MKKKLLSVALCVAMAATALVGCGSKDSKDETTKAANGGANDAAKGDKSKGSVYFLNFKPEAEETFNNIAKKFTEETKIPCKVVTAANNQYESTLKSEMAKSDSPTAFIINGPVGYNNWKDYCANIKDSELYNTLVDKNGVVSSGDGVYGIPLATETYGLICNKAIFAKYFALSGIADTGCKSIEDINNFKKLKAVVEDMQKHKGDLGIKGVFSEIALSSNDNWRIQTHLANLPVYYEYKKDGVTDTDALKFTYAENYKNILDLYLDNSTTDRKSASTGSVDEAMTEFALNECAIAQNGTWAWSDTQLNQPDSKVKADDLYYMPIYTGVEGEESQGLCMGTENFLAINSKASADDQAASLYFFEWLYSSDAGKKCVLNDLGFVAPFNTFTSDEAPDNPLVKAGLADLNNDKTTTVSWVFPTFPSQNWKDKFGADLLSYAEGSMDWDTVIKNATDSWASEKKASK